MAGSRGFTNLESLVAMLLVAVALVASLRLTVTVIGVIGKRVAPGATAADQTPARLRSIAAAWAQSELEFIKQIGDENACPATSNSCGFLFPRDCAGAAAPPPSPFGVGPEIPAGFWAGRVGVTWDPKSPEMPDPDNPSPAPPLKLLRLVRVDAYHTQADCQVDRPLVTAYTSLSRRR